MNARLHKPDPSPSLLGLVVAGLAASCGTSGGNQALSLAGDVVGHAVSGSASREKPAVWSMDRARCAVFRNHRMACPALRTCKALLGTAEPGLTVNVCANDMGDLEAIKWCSYGGNWCRASAFPACETAQRWSCDDFEVVVCEEDLQRQRILRSRVDPASGRCNYELATFYDDEKRD